MAWLAGSIVVTAGLWLVGLALSIVIAPRRAERLLTGFASSARVHYAEQVLRLIAGGAFIACSGDMRFPDLFRGFGWLIVGTTSGLLLIPWRWHRRFAEWVMPRVIRHLGLYAVGAFGLGAFILFAVLAP